MSGGFRDLDHDGQMAPYEDPGAPIEARVDDLLGRLRLPEKAGLMFHAMVMMGDGGRLMESMAEGAFQAAPTSMLIGDLAINHVNLVGGGSAAEMASWHNALQALAASTRLGIPVTVSSDPRHHFTDNPLTSAMSGALSQWPETLGLAALRDDTLVERFADAVRREYVAVGIRVALHPQVDLATEPRWSRISGTFGEDPGLTSTLVAAYIRGLQGERLGQHSVAAMTKHFPGGGPQLDGEDAHFSYGREQVYPGRRFEDHLAPFKAAIAAGTSQMMPYYGMPVGTEYEEVGFGFNHGIVTELLRGELGFDGLVCSDWGLVTDGDVQGELLPARAWGVEHLPPLDRVQKIIDAGVDQLGGEQCPELIVELVESGRVSVARIDESVRRILREKFVLGLFDDPFVDEVAAVRILGDPAVHAEAQAAQSAALTVLTNQDRLLPLGPGRRVFAPNLDQRVLSNWATAVGHPDEADVCVVRLGTPYDPRPGAFEGYFHAGRLYFTHEELAPVLALADSRPTIVVVNLERPAVLSPIVETAHAVVADFGASDEAVLAGLFGAEPPRGRLPFDLPRTADSVERQRTDVPFDLDDPLFQFGHGLTYHQKGRS